MLVLAAGLWLVYLVPNWLRRREFEATERNAVRLQQTIRVLAETSEGPAVPQRRGARRPGGEGVAPGRDAVAPAFAGRPVVASGAGQGVASAVVPAGPGFAQRMTASGPMAMQAHELRARSAQRIRRSRATASAVLLLGLLTLVIQLVVAAVTAWSPGGVLVAGLGAVLMASAIALLRRLASVRAGAPVQRRAPVADGVFPELEWSSERPVRAWTPVAVPPPLARPRVAPSTMSDPRVAAAAAADERERARRGAHREVVALPPASAPAPDRTPAASRFAAMGVVDAAVPQALPDLNAALARRRA